MALTADDLRQIAIRKLSAAKALLSHSADEAAQMAGYAVEVQLKAHIVDFQKLGTWPEDRRAFRARGLKHLQIHELHELLVHSGRETHVKANCLAEWSTCVTWSPETRYAVSGSITPEAATAMLDAVEKLLKHL